MAHIVKIEKNISNGFPCRVNIDGVVFPSISYVYKEYGLSPVSITSLENSGMTKEEAISYAIDHVDEINKKRKERKERAEENRKKYALEEAKRKEKRERAVFVYEGKIYKKFRRAVEDISWDNDIILNAESIKASAKRNNRSLEEQLKVTIKKHLARKKKEEDRAKEVTGIFYDKMMGEIYHEAVIMIKEKGLSSLSDKGALNIISKGAGISLKHAKRLLEDLLENEGSYSRFDYENRNEIRKNRKYDMYSNIYGRYDWGKD